MKLKKDQQRWLQWISEHGTPRGMTLGRGRPHDQRIVQSLIDANMIDPVFSSRGLMVNEYAVRGEEDSNGLALFMWGDTCTGATHWGCRVKPFGSDEYGLDESGEPMQNGIDTAWATYPHNEFRRDWFCHAIAQATLAMHD